MRKLFKSLFHILLEELSCHGVVLGLAGKFFEIVEHLETQASGSDVTGLWQLWRNLIKYTLTTSLGFEPGTTERQCHPLSLWHSLEKHSFQTWSELIRPPHFSRWHEMQFHQNFLLQSPTLKVRIYPQGPFRYFWSLSSNDETRWLEESPYSKVTCWTDPSVFLFAAICNLLSEILKCCVYTKYQKKKKKQSCWMISIVVAVTLQWGKATQSVNTRVCRAGGTVNEDTHLKCLDHS